MTQGRTVAPIVALALGGACGRIGFDPGSTGGDAPTTPDAPQCSPSIDLDSDPDNCGVCGRGCLGGACNAGTCAPIELSPIVSPMRSVLVIGDQLYFSSQGAIRRMSTSGGTVETVATVNGAPFRLVRDGDHLYFHTRDTGTIGRTPIDAQGGAAEIFETDIGDTSAVASDGTFVYWSDYNATARVRKTPIAGGMRSDVTTTNVTFMSCLRRVGTALYYVRENVGMFRVDSAGGTPVSVAAAGSFEIEIDGDDAFVENLARNRIVKVSLSTGEITELGDSTRVWGIALDATHVYYANEGGDSIARVPRAGGPTEVLATADEPVGIAVDDKAVYWTERLGRVFKLAK